MELTKNPDAMITALRKIEGRGELPGATSAVMELCVDNPREGFADLFATHPSVQSRVDKPGAVRRRPRSRTAGTCQRMRRDEPQDSGTAPCRPAAAASPRGPWSDASEPPAAGPACPGDRVRGDRTADPASRQFPAGT